MSSSSSHIPFSSSSSSAPPPPSSSSSPALQPKKPVKPGSKTPPRGKTGGTKTGVAQTGDGGCGAPEGSSGQPVRYFNGEVVLSMTDVSGGLGGFGHTRSYSNQLDEEYEGPNGNNWLIPSWPYLVQETSGSDNVLVMVAGQNRVWFDKSGSTYTARYGGEEGYTLATGSGNTFVLTTRGGGAATAVFHDFTQSTHPKGFVKESTDAYGKTTTVHSYNGESIEKVRRTEGSALWSLVYTFFGTGSHTDRIETATIRKSSDSGSNWTDIRRASYSYHTGNTAYGSRNDLETVTVQYPESGSTWGDASKTYYRWYKDGDTNGFAGGLRYVVGSAAYAEMLADSLTPETATNAQVEEAADHYFEYDSSSREVTKEIAKDCAGCGGGGGTGQNGETFARTESAHADGYNNWKWKVVLTKANGNVETVYTNYLGQVMLKELKESSSSSRKWITYTEYGTSGGSVAKVVKSATPAAVSSYNESSADLGVTLRKTAGLISYSTYYDTTGIRTGAAKGYLQQTEISEGTAGTKIIQQAIKYTVSNNMTGEKVYVPSKTTRYRDDAGTEAIETTYAYEWYVGGSVPGAAMKQRTTTLPAVPVGQNGDGTSATTRQFYDTDGRITFSQNEREIVTKNTYDAATGRMTKSQVDVEQSEAGMPSGWTVGGSTPHENVTTEYEYDDLGRQVQVLGQAHDADLGGSSAEEVRHATWTVYQEGVSSNQTWTARGYHKTASGGSDHLVNPVSISFTDKNGRPIDQIQSKRSTGSGKLSATDTFLRADWSRWSTSIYSTVGLLEYTRAYHTIPAQSPDLGLGGVTSDPGTSGSNYEETHFGYDLETNLRVRTLTPGGTVSRTVYDAINRPRSQWIGTNDGGANWDTWDPASPGTNMKKVSENQYDGGNAGGNSYLTRSTQHADDNTTRETNFTYDFRSRRTSTTDPIGRVGQPTYNNLGQTTKSEQYDGDPAGSGTLIGKSESSFDDRGRVYETKSYAVDPDNGTVGNALTGENWYDAAGAVTKSIAPGAGGVFSKNTYDNLGRRISGYTAYESGGSEVIVAEGETTFNEVGQSLYSTTKQRDTDTPSGSPTFRTSYSANWYDGVGRGFASAAYGTNGGSSFTRPDTAPARSDTVLVSSMAYNDAGEAFSSTDPKGIETRREYDDMGRVTSQIDNYKAPGSSGGSSGTDINRTTAFTYTADSQQATITAKMTASANDEVTTYLYGVTTSGGSGINANNVLAAVQYPEDTTTKRIDLKVNRLGQLIEREDQNGTVHQIAYDGLGRPTSDAVTTVGTGVDDAVRRLTTSYTTRGQAQALTSYSETADSVPGNTALNQVEFEYNDFGQLTSDWQEHDGTVTTSGGSASKRVQYGFDDGASSSNQIRPESMTYPDNGSGGRQLDFSYGTSGGGYDLFNQVHAIKDGSTDLVEYKYLGGGRPVVADYTEPNIKLDLWGGTAGSYDGLDGFGRVIDQQWINYAGSPVDVARFEYGYDRDSVVSYRRDTVAHALSKGFDELYTRDGLNRLNDFQRGLLNSGNTAIPSSDLDFQQDWALDQVANWTGFNQDDNGDGTDNLVQTRTHNKVNEITAITNTTGGAWDQPAYDDAGNMTTLPKPDAPADGFTAKYDAWNRLVALSDESTGTKVAEYAYDPRGFRIRKELHTAGVLSSTIDSYYTSGWQCIEENETSSGGSSSSSYYPSSSSSSYPSSSSSGTTTTTTQYVYGLRYIDDIVCRDRTPQGGSTTRLYYLNDRRFNVVAITDTSGNVLERYAYAPYGEQTVLAASFVTKTGGTDYAQQHGFQGLRHDEESGLIENRARMLAPGIGRFLQRDPLGYPDGMNAYVAYHVLYSEVDPIGLWSLVGAFNKHVLGYDSDLVAENERMLAAAARREAEASRRRGEEAAARQMEALARESDQRAQDNSGGNIPQDVTDAMDQKYAEEVWDRTNGTLEGLSRGNVDLSSVGYADVDPSTGKAYTFDAQSRQENECFAACVADVTLNLLNPVPAPVHVFEVNEPWIEPLSQSPLDWAPGSANAAGNVFGVLADRRSSNPWRTTTLYLNNGGQTPLPPPPKNVPAHVYQDAMRGGVGAQWQGAGGQLKMERTDNVRNSHSRNGRIFRGLGKAAMVALYFKSLNDCRKKCFC